MTMTNRDADPLSIEWVYALAPQAKMMAIFATENVTKKPPAGVNSHHCESSRTIHLDGTEETDPESWYVHRLIKVIRLDGPEPNWDAIEEG